MPPSCWSGHEHMTLAYRCTIRDSCCGTATPCPPEKISEGPDKMKRVATTGTSAYCAGNGVSKLYASVAPRIIPRPIRQRRARWADLEESRGTKRCSESTSSEPADISQKRLGRM